MSKTKFGKAFPDQFHKHTTKLKHFHPKIDSGSDWQEGFIYGAKTEDEIQTISVWRKVFILIVLMISLSVLLARLLHLQLVEGKDNRELADSNRIKIKIIHASRGVIYDRNGKILAQNEPGFRLLEQKDSKIKVRYLSRDEALNLEVNSNTKSSQLEVDHIRNYPLQEKTAHILGYVGEINSDELKVDAKKYQAGDKVGKSGLEEVYESSLRGIDGGEIIEVDAEGNKIRSLRETEAIPGQNLYLTIDADLQEVVYKQLEVAVKKAKSCCGAAVAEDPHTGQILALVSYPSFDPKNIEAAITNPDSPLLNRIISGLYPPGSVFKISAALAGLDSGKITPFTIFEDQGVVTLGQFTFTNWYFSQYGRTEGNLNIVQALKRSNDVYFYRLGQVIGEKQLAKTARELSLGKTLGIDLSGEQTGLIPDNDWKISKIGDVWYPGDTLHMAIGQGFVLTTPLQLNSLISQIASNGKQYIPHLALKITGPSGNLIKEYKFDPNKSYHFKAEDIKTVKKGLEGVTTAGGTAWPFFSFPIPTVGKTGTAEFGDPKNRTHAWYVSYAPADDPKIALTILVEGGGEGSNVAAPVAKEIYRWYLSPDKNNLIKDLWEEASPSSKALGE